ncbi:signal peptide peptidase SppA [Pseudoalteromonas citrea]|uniref:Signal peptide peptidase SppA n=1 Tax=Pseudoalteromonas citrea TaxID=43655 RepID=A0A5S3XLM0_9GAMM|nr:MULTISPECIES: signal peptide peptidase SppA [Pseudoalteromonas]RJE77573.1 signal peptide peptidase SppA [Pseudoalteromonas sp. MSK9-3]TMP42011.1 signal peptide peptidase SppA [Pseudoalteromonas citrea]TMP56303.1 signal peptide peptidase SppA [Pseudoalteromonas citrea]
MNLIGKLFKGLWHGLNFSRRLILNLLFLGIIVALIVGISSDSEEIIVDENSVLRLNLKGSLVEELTYIDPFDAALNDATSANDQPKEILLDDVIRVIKQAKDDERIQVLLLDLKHLRGGHLDKLRTIADTIDEFKESGKKVLAHGAYYSQGQYYLASKADTISLHPYGGIEIRGYASYPLYFKEALEKLKVTQHIFRVGTFKSAVEPFIRNDMSDSAKEANKLWLNELWAQYKQDISVARQFDSSNFDETTENYLSKMEQVKGDYAQYALENGWVDALKTDQELQQELVELVGKNKSGKSFKQISFAKYLSYITPPVDFVNPVTEKVAVIIARGNIVDGKQKAGTIGGESTAALLKRARLDDKVKAVVLRIDSGGGSMFASEIIRNEVLAIKDAGKPVVASMGSVAASGGYWIAASANEIWASPSTITGSIGVFGLFMTFENALNDLGIYSDGVATTELNDISLSRGVNPQLAQVFQLGVENAYDKFIGVVADSRGLEKAAVDKVAQGRVWTATQAKEFGLVDNLGNKQDAISAAAKLANLDFYDVITIEQTLSEKEMLLREIFGNAMVKETLSALAPQSNLLKLVERNLGQVSTDLERHLSTLSNMNDPNGIYTQCVTCQITY